MLFENRVSSRFADLLMAEKARMMSTKEAWGAVRAKSTRLYAIAASTVGSAERNRCRSIETVSLVTYKLNVTSDIRLSPE